MVRWLVTISMVMSAGLSAGQSLNFSMGLANNAIDYGSNNFTMQSDAFSILESSELLKVNRIKDEGTVQIREIPANKQISLRMGLELRGKKQWAVQIWTQIGIARGSDYMGRMVTVRTDNDLMSPVNPTLISIPAGTTERFGLYHPSIYTSSGISYYIPLRRRKRLNYDLVIGFGRTSLSTGKPFDPVTGQSAFNTTSNSLLARTFLDSLANNEFSKAGTFGFSTSILGVRFRYGNHHLTFASVSGVSNPFKQNGDDTPWIDNLYQFRITYAYNLGYIYGKPPGWFADQFRVSAYDKAEELRADHRKSSASVSKLETSIFIGIRSELGMAVPFNDSSNYYQDSTMVVSNNDTIIGYARYGHNYNPSHGGNNFGEQKTNFMGKMRSIPFITIDVRRDLSRYFELGTQLSYGYYRLFPAGKNNTGKLNYPVEYRAYSMTNGVTDSLLASVLLNPGHRRLHLISIRPHFALRTKRTALTELNIRSGIKISFLHANFEHEEFSRMGVEQNNLSFTAPANRELFYDMESFNPNRWVIANRVMVQSMIGIDYERGRWEFSLNIESRMFGGVNNDSYITGFSQVGLGAAYKLGYWQR